MALVFESFEHYLPDDWASQSSQPTHVFKRQGQHWLIGARGNVKPVPNRKGFAYIHYLLARPNERLSVSDLVTAVDGTDPSTIRDTSDSETDVQATLEGIRITTDLGNSGERIDDTAKRQYLRRSKEIEKDLSEAYNRGDDDKARELEEEQNSIRKELAAGLTATGQKRKMRWHVDSERTRIQKAIRSAIDTIKEGGPQVASLLTIETGYDLRYVPNRDKPSWDL